MNESNSDLYDALIIGAGPAGATTAALLAANGWSVALVERSSFPRRKVCGEVISPTNVACLQDLGVLTAVRNQAGPALREVALFAGHNRIVAHLPALDAMDTGRGFTCAREFLDTILRDRAVHNGATLWQPWQVTGLVQSADGVYSCELTQQSAKHVSASTFNEKLTLRARIVIAAHGSWSRSGLPSDSATTPKRPGDLFAFKAHLRGCNLQPGLLPVLAFKGGYGGIVRIDSERSTFAFCIRRDVLHAARQEHPGQRAAVAASRHVLEQIPALRSIIADSVTDGPWLSVGPLRTGYRHPPSPGLFLIGNALCETHPLIGEGMTMAMQSACLLSSHLCKRPKPLTPASVSTVAVAFAHDWRQHFSMRRHCAAIFAHAAMHPTLVRALIPWLRRHPELLTFAARLSGKVRPLRSVHLDAVLMK